MDLQLTLQFLPLPNVETLINKPCSTLLMAYLNVISQLFSFSVT